MLTGFSSFLTAGLRISASTCVNAEPRQTSGLPPCLNRERSSPRLGKKNHSPLKVADLPAQRYNHPVTLAEQLFRPVKASTPV